MKIIHEKETNKQNKVIQLSELHFKNNTTLFTVGTYQL